MKPSILLLLPALLFTLSACQDAGYDATDTDEIGASGEVLGAEEVADEGVSGQTGTWDANADTYLDENEFRTGVGGGTWWNDWDANDDTFLDENEFNTAFSNETWHNEGLFGEWDADADNQLTSDEWEAGLFDTWDADDDTRLAETEYDAGLFG